MKWLKITVVFFLITLVKSGPTRSEEPNPEPEPEAEPETLTLQKIQKTDVDKFTFKLDADSPPGTKSLRLVVDDGTKQTEFNSDKKDDPSLSYNFQIDTSQILKNPFNFEILALDETGDTLGYAKIDDFQWPEFPTSLQGDKLKDPRDPTGKEFILRVKGDLGSMEFSAPDIIVEDTTNDIRYYRVIDDSDYSLCSTEKGVNICDKPVISEPVESTQDEILTSAILSYGPPAGDAANVKLVAKTTDHIDIDEAILIQSVPTDNKLCSIDATKTTKCPITWSAPSEETLQLIIIRKTSDGESPPTELWTTSFVVIQDRTLIATSLGTDILEGRWTIHENEAAFYRIVKTTTGSNDDDTRTVDCEHITDPKVCYGYFSKVVAGTYTLTVAYQIDPSPTYNKTDQIESQTVLITGSPPTELGILSRHTTRHANQLMADVNICFEHLTPTEGRSFSHYEMLIINEKGQWLKHRIMEEEEEKREGRLCFTPFAINTRDFDLTEGTKVVVSQRGVDGFTVLATGQSKLL